MGDGLDISCVEDPHAPPEEFAEQKNHVNRAAEYPLTPQHIF